MKLLFSSDGRYYSLLLQCTCMHLWLVFLFSRIPGGCISLRENKIPYFMLLSLLHGPLYPSLLAWSLTMILHSPFYSLQQWLNGFRNVIAIFSVHRRRHVWKCRVASTINAWYRWPLSLFCLEDNLEIANRRRPNYRSVVWKTGLFNQLARKRRPWRLSLKKKLAINAPLLPTQVLHLWTNL